MKKKINHGKLCSENFNVLPTFYYKVPSAYHHIITLYRTVETYGPKYSVLDLKTWLEQWLVSNTI